MVFPGGISAIFLPFFILMLFVITSFFLDDVFYIKSISLLVAVPYFIGMPAGFIFAYKMKKSSQPDFKFNFCKSESLTCSIYFCTGILIVSMLSFVFIMLVSIQIIRDLLNLKFMTQYELQQTLPALHLPIYTYFVFIILIAPLLEEFLWRGIMLDGLLSNYSKFKAIWINTFAFSMVHGVPLLIFMVIPIAFILDWVYSNTKSLKLVYFIHLFNNLLVFASFVNTKITQTIPEDVNVIQALQIFAVGMTIFVFCVVWLSRKFKQIKNE
jgi:membrane protease YdiL (CAAX protease family)